MSGRTRSISSHGVGSSNNATKSTACSAASTQARSAPLLSGRCGPLPRRRADASLLRPTSSAAPSARACARYVTWPRCNTSNTPLVNTSGRGQAVLATWSGLRILLEGSGGTMCASTAAMTVEGSALSLPFAQHLAQHRELFHRLDAMASDVAHAAQQISDTLRQGGKVMFCG